MSFKDDFVWGAAAASYQIEGGAFEDGKGRSVWDVFAHTPDKVFHADTGDVACDHYHRSREDVELMKQIGLQAYRFSVSWPRVIPDGAGKVNEPGLAFYDRLVDQLLSAGIEPWVTLFHWDYPYELYRRGGWLNDDSPKWFADYARVVVERLSDRVSHWMTLNEPQCFIDLGHRQGIHAPGLVLPLSELLLAGHHTLLAHGLGVQAIRSAAKTAGRIGWAPVGMVSCPASDSQKDVDAARTAMFSYGGEQLFQNAYWNDPVFFGRYPDDVLKKFGEAMPAFTDDEMRTIAQPLDFFGVNVYQGRWVRAGSNGPEQAPFPTGGGMTAIKWYVHPEALYWGAKFYHERYGLPIVVTENGMSGTDWVMLDGQVHDPQRVDFMTRYLRQLRAAGAEGVPVDGYFHWSIMDNFEWHKGYGERFGIIHVDYDTLNRTPKDSAEWYSEIIASNGGVLDGK